MYRVTSTLIFRYQLVSWDKTNRMILWDISRATMEDCGYKEESLEDLLRKDEEREELEATNKARTLDPVEDEANVVAAEEETQGK